MKRLVKVILWAAIAIIAISGVISFTSIEQGVAEDAVKQYNIAKREGDPIQICVSAGLVTAAYLQAKDEKNYAEWKAVERSVCSAAGL